MPLEIPAKLAEKMNNFLASEKFKMINHYRLTNRFIEATDRFKWMRLTFEKGKMLQETSYLIPRFSDSEVDFDSDKTITINTDELHQSTEDYPDTGVLVRKLRGLQENGITLNISAKHLKEICELIIESSEEERPILSMHVKPESLAIGFSTNHFEVPKVEAILALVVNENEIDSEELARESMKLVDRKRSNSGS